MSENAPIRIVRIRYRSGVNGRVATAFAKVPYSHMLDLADRMARLLAIRQVRWYRLDAASPAEIAANRASLARWPEALAATAGTTRIEVMA
jgi:hypothetical protein